MRWSAHAVILALGLAAAHDARAGQAAALHLGTTPDPQWLAARKIAAAHLAPSTALMQVFRPAALHGLCPTCVGPWRVDVAASANFEAPLFALQASRPLGLGRGLHGDHAPWQAQPWHLGLQAHALTQPGERRVIAALCRAHRDANLQLGLEALEAEISPAPDQPGGRRRMLRRTGAVAAFKLRAWRSLADRDDGDVSDASLAPTFADGVHLSGALRLWPGVSSRPMLDSRAGVQLASRPKAHGGGQIWAGLGWRGLIGTDDALLRAGGWRMPSAVGEDLHVLREDVPGYEDLARYTARMARAQVGLGTTLGCRARVDMYAAATQLDALSRCRPHLLRAVGASVRLGRSRRRGVQGATLAYQVARRLDGNRGPWLHMLTASL